MESSSSSPPVHYVTIQSDSSSRSRPVLLVEPASSDEDTPPTPLRSVSIRNPELAGKEEYMGVSVHYLKNRFPKEVEDAGLSLESTIYELEDLEGPSGVFRRKGANVICPILKRRGAAYVHCLKGEDNVGDATHMLSYTWKHTIRDILTTIVDVCNTQQLDPKCTYFWICCFCVNQHQVVAEREHNKAVLTNDFIQEFESRVCGIGRIVCMMSPWKQPYYLTRAWCIFEIATAFERNEECEVIVAMPPEQKKRLEDDLVFNAESSSDFDTLYKALANTKVQESSASVEADRVIILERLKSQTGGYSATNNRVNEHLRKWIIEVMENLVKTKEKLVKRKAANKKEKLEYALVCNNVGFTFQKIGENGKAIALYRRALSIREKELGVEHPATATSCNNVGSVLKKQGDYNGALEQYRKALDIRKKVLGMTHSDTAGSYCNLGLILSKLGDYCGAAVNLRKAALIRKALLGLDHPETALSFNNIGVVLEAQGNYSGALEEYRKALVIREAVFGKEHPDTATSYNNIGNVLWAQGDFDAALVELRKAVAIKETILGKRHPDTATSYNNIGKVLRAMGDYDGALVELSKAAEIREAVPGGENHPNTAMSYYRIGGVLKVQGYYIRALVEYHKALFIWEAKLGECHPKTINVSQKIDQLKSELANCFLGMRAPEQS